MGIDLCADCEAVDPIRGRPAHDIPESQETTAKWPTHHILCGAGVIILEGCKLADIKDGNYFMCCLPMRLKGSEAAATRTILIEGVSAQ